MTACVLLIKVLMRFITRQIANAIYIKINRTIHASIFHATELISSCTKKRKTIAATMFIKRNGGKILFSQLFSNDRIITSELYLFEIFEMISILKGIKKAMITASNAATSDKNVGFGLICPNQLRHEK